MQLDRPRERLGCGDRLDDVVAIVVIGIVSSFPGHAIATQLSPDLLRRGFAMYLVAMSLYVVASGKPKLIRQEAQVEKSVSYHSIVRQLPSATYMARELTATGSSKLDGDSR